MVSGVQGRAAQFGLTRFGGQLADQERMPPVQAPQGPNPR